MKVTILLSNFCCNFFEIGALEWAGQGLDCVFAQKKNLFSFSFWRMLWDVFRFAAETPRVLDETTKEFDDMTLGQFLTKNNYSASFISNYILPMTSAIWSTPMKGMLGNHNLFYKITFLHSDLFFL